MGQPAEYGFVVLDAEVDDDGVRVIRDLKLVHAGPIELNPYYRPVRTGSAAGGAGSAAASPAAGSKTPTG